MTGIFSIPDAKIIGNPKFPVGEIEFRLTSDRDNYGQNASQVEPVSEAWALYYATGMFQQEQGVILSLRPSPAPPQPVVIYVENTVIKYINNEPYDFAPDADDGL